MYTADELEIRRALAGSPRSEQLIACLEGEIAKRDVRIVELEGLILDAKARLNGPPVSEAKAQGVVMPEPLMAAITRADDVLHALSNWESSSVKLEQRHGPEWTKEVDAIRRELHTQLARLNAAPVQQVSVPDGWKLVPVEATEAILDVLYSNGMDESDSLLQDIWSAMLANAPAAPAADAGLVDALEMIINPIEAMRRELQGGEQLNGMVAMQLASDPEYLRGVAKAALAAHSAKGVV